MSRNDGQGWFLFSAQLKKNKKKTAPMCSISHRPIRSRYKYRPLVLCVWLQGLLSAKRNSGIWCNSSLTLHAHSSSRNLHACVPMGPRVSTVLCVCDWTWGVNITGYILCFDVTHLSDNYLIPERVLLCVCLCVGVFECVRKCAQKGTFTRTHY